MKTISGTFRRKNKQILNTDWLGLNWLSLLIIVLMSLTLVSCLGDQSSSGSESGTTVVNQPTPGEPSAPLTTPDRTICDPFNTGSPTAEDRGVVANMVWLDSTMPPLNGQPSLQHVSDYLAIGNVVQSTLYFDRIYVPTRPFDLGFTTQTGEQVLNAEGQPMYEYFALHMQGQFQLSPTENPGNYQIALLSDDGSVLKVSDGNGGQTLLVDNDGDHPTRMGCPVTTVNMQRDTKLPFNLDYYQGPRYHIAMVLMWRPVPDGTNPDIPIADPYCGQSGNGLFFDSTQTPSAPQQHFDELLARGWKVLENENYYFPAQATNPCVPTEPSLSISGFQVTALFKPTPTTAAVTLSWSTNIASSSQIQYRNVVSGVIANTVVDPTLTTTHTVTVTGLSTNTLYAFKGISVSAGGQTAISDEAAQRTNR